MNTENRLSVIIVNYKTPDLVLNCVRSLENQIDHIRDHVFIVDNNSGNDDVVNITNALRQYNLSNLVTIIPSHHNKGFSAGNNIGITYSTAQYYLLTNSDTLLRPDAISNLLSAAALYPDAGIISPRLEWPDGTPQVSCFRFHTPVSELINSAGTGVITRLLKGYDVPLDITNVASYPDWTSFACVLIKHAVIEKIGLLDENYFMYYEDVDYCRRAKNAGFEIVNWPFAHVVHLQGMSSDVNILHKNNKRLPAYYYQSRARYFTKNYGKRGFIVSNICWITGRIISLFRKVIFGSCRQLPEYQHFDIWKK